jgi:hypothetical protein
VSPTEHPAPPPGEEIHLPEPSFLPFFCAVGITLAVIGTTISFLISAVGILILLYTAIRWIGDTRRDIDALPSEHRR